MGKYSAHKIPSDILASTAQHVATLRKQQRWTQQDLAIKSGVSFGSIKRFERSGQISFASLLKIAEALNRLADFETILLPNDDIRIRKLFNDQK